LALGDVTPSNAAGGNVVSLGGGTAWNAPLGVTGNSLGGIYIADSGSNQIHLVDVAAGLRFHIAGDGRVGYTGDGSLATGVAMNGPAGIAVDGSGHLYVADRDNHRVRVIDAQTGVISTVSGSGRAGYSGDGSQATDARLNTPLDVFVDREGDLYIADTANNRIRRVNGKTGTIESIVGSGRIGQSFGSFGGDGGQGSLALLRVPSAVFVDDDGNLLIADSGNNRIRRVEAETGIINTIAGVGTGGFGGDGGLATEARLSFPSGMFLDSDGHLFVADMRNHRIRKIDSAGIISTVAGSGNPGFSGDGGAALGADFNSPSNVHVDGGGHFYVADSGNNRIRRISYAGAPTVLTPGEFSVGSGLVPPFVVTSWPVNGAVNIDPTVIEKQGVSILFSEAINPDFLQIRIEAGTSAMIWNATWSKGHSQLDLSISTRVDFGGSYTVFLSGIFDNYGNSANDVSLRFDTRPSFPQIVQGTIRTIAGRGVPGFGGDGGPASEMMIHSPSNIFVDGDGNMYIVDTGNNRIRKVNASTGRTNTVAGNGAAKIAGSIVATGARLDHPNGIFVSPNGKIYIADQENNQVQLVDATGTMTTVAGNGAAGYSGDGGAATSASLNGPSDVVLDNNGNLYISDKRNARVRMVDPSGRISTVAGDGILGYSGDGGPAISAGLADLKGITVDASGDLYLADGGRVRKVEKRSGVITTVAGGGNLGSGLGDGGPAIVARLLPEDVEVDQEGNLYISDLGRIRRVDAVWGTITSVAGSGRLNGFTGDGGPALDASFSASGIFLDGKTGDLFVADKLNHRIRRIDQLAVPNLDDTVVDGGANPDPAAPEVAAIQASDFNGNGKVDFSDFIDLVLNFGLNETDLAFNAMFDLDGNGAIGFSDFVRFVRVYGKSTTG